MVVTFIAFIFSLFMPGLGQYYLGRSLTAIVTYIICIFIMSLLWLDPYTTFCGLIAWISMLAFFTGYHLIRVVHLGLKTRKRNDRLHQSWISCVLMMLGHGLVIFAVLYGLGLPFKIYRIPTNSMSPTLQVGDFFLIDRQYDPKKELQIGDVVVFSSPTTHDIDFVKRIAGLPGDTIKKRKGVILINGTPLSILLKQSAPIHSPTTRFKQTEYYFEPETVPENHVFVLGDNPKDSFDSRFFKSINFNTIKGKALYIIWARDKSRIGNPL